MAVISVSVGSSSSMCRRSCTSVLLKAKEGPKLQSRNVLIPVISDFGSSSQNATSAITCLGLVEGGLTEVGPLGTLGVTGGSEAELETLISPGSSSPSREDDDGVSIVSGLERYSGSAQAKSVDKCDAGRAERCCVRFPTEPFKDSQLFK